MYLCESQVSNYLYTVSGITNWLQEHKFPYKKPKVTPLQANSEKKKAFIESYNNLKHNTLEDEPILLGALVHPAMAKKVSYGWIKTGSDRATGKQMYLLTYTPGLLSILAKVIMLIFVDSKG